MNKLDTTTKLVLAGLGVGAVLLLASSKSSGKEDNQTPARDKPKGELKSAIPKGTMPITERVVKDIDPIMNPMLDKVNNVLEAISKHGDVSPNAYLDARETLQKACMDVKGYIFQPGKSIPPEVTPDTTNARGYLANFEQQCNTLVSELDAAFKAFAFPADSWEEAKHDISTFITSFELLQTRLKKSSCTDAPEILRRWMDGKNLSEMGRWFKFILSEDEASPQADRIKKVFDRIDSKCNRADFRGIEKGYIRELIEQAANELFLALGMLDSHHYEEANIDITEPLPDESAPPFPDVMPPQFKRVTPKADLTDGEYEIMAASHARKEFIRFLSPISGELTSTGFVVRGVLDSPISSESYELVIVRSPELDRGRVNVKVAAVPSLIVVNKPSAVDREWLELSAPFAFLVNQQVPPLRFVGPKGETVEAG